MHVYGARGPLSDTPQLGEYEVVLAWEAEAAIAAAVEDFRAAMSEGTWYQSGLENGYEQGQRDMLAKCISMIADIDDNGDPDIRYMLSDVTARLSNQPPPLPPSVGVPEKRGSLW